MTEHDFPASTGPSTPAEPRRRGRTLLSWACFALIAAATGVAVTASVHLHRQAEARHERLAELAVIEVRAVEQAGLVWRGLTLRMAEQRMPFVRLRGEEQRKREDLRALLSGLGGGEDEPDQRLRAAGDRFLAGVQSAFGQMSMSERHVRDRLRWWDMNHGEFEEVLFAARDRERTAAAAASDAASRTTLAASAGTLFVVGLLVFLLGRQRAQRLRDLDRQRLEVVAASESRFRALVQHSSDPIYVLEPDGRVRYATPSAGPVPPDAPVEAVLGRGIDAFLAGGSAEIRPTAGAGTPDGRVLEVRSRDLRDDPAVGGIVLNARDVTEAKRLEARLRHQATHDPLTDLPNRRNYQEAFDELSAEARVGGGVLFVDLDGFKRVNDSYGHQTGDQLLVTTAARLGACLGPDDLLARQGGDEFLVLVAPDPGGDEAPTEHRASRIAETLRVALAPPFTLDGQEVFVSASIGVLIGLDGLDAEQAAQRADIAMYAAKQAGKSRAVVFTEDLLAGAPQRLALETDFRRALERDEFTVVYQPKVGLRSGRCESLEALVRWEHPERGFVGPDAFIPFAEETGLIGELGRRVLRRACLDAVRWQDRGVVVAVNVSPVQFQNPGLVDEVAAALADSGLAAGRLELEVTESAVLGDVHRTIDVLRRLRGLGVRLAIDDFGTGYSNLAHLKHFDVDVLKIDQAFVRGGGAGLPGTRDHLCDGPIVEAVIGMAKAFDLHVVAEGVESVDHADQLRDLGADLGQGYHFSKPVDVAGIDAFLAAEHARLGPPDLGLAA